MKPSRSAPLLLVVLSALLAAGCAAPRSASAAGGAPPPCQAPGVAAAPALELRGAPIELPRSPELDEIARLEEQRDTGGGRLQALLGSADARVRERSAVALGRLPRWEEFPAPAGPPVDAALCSALADADARVRAAAAFALGLRTDPASAPLLASFLQQELDAGVRARLVEAASKFEDAALHALVVRALADPDEGVRIEAACGAARWNAKEAEADAVDTALLRALAPLEAIAPASERLDEQAAILYALSRRAAEKGRGAFLEFSRSTNVLARIFATKGLAVVQPTPEGARTLRNSLEDPDWRVATEAALALGARPDPDALEALFAAQRHASAHVRAAATRALGAVPAWHERAQVGIDRALRDVSASVRVAGLVALARLESVAQPESAPAASRPGRALAPPRSAAARLREFLNDTDAVVRAGLAEAAVALPEPQALELLDALLRDRSSLVATNAADHLGTLSSEAARTRLVALLSSSDDGLKLSAVGALRASARAADLPELELALASAHSEIEPELACNVVQNLGRIGGPRAIEYARSLLDHPTDYVRRTAARTLAKELGQAEPARAPRSQRTTRIALPGAELPNWTRNPIVGIDTTRGTLVFELLPAEAPQHVASFRALALQGRYEGASFHRVVADFVVQGGDPRGDGNGGRDWRGASLRAEFGPRKYERGSLGMPRSDDPDSGGCQLFVTQRATPHLDGRYTIFGLLRAGQAVLDQLEIGDRILAVRWIDDPAPRH